MYSCSEEDRLGDCGHGREWFGQGYSLFLTFLMLLQSNSTGLSLCSLSSPHHPTAGFSFYITLKVKHLTSPWRPFKAARSLQITYNSQKVSSLSPDRSLMPASFNLHMLAFQRSSFMSSLTLPPRSSLHTSVKLPHYPPPDTMESSLCTGCLWQSPDNEATGRLSPLLAVLPTLCPITPISSLLVVSFLVSSGFCPADPVQS